ncbi:MAG: TRAP transporter small permease [Saprospiraceae bacterium]|nr:TRAP transporter small permease [Saprospiraceae bacterium]
MRIFIQKYFEFLQLLLTLMLMLLTIPVLLQVTSRFIPIIPRYIWTEEVARFAFIWVIMLGAIVAVREKTHFKVDLLPNLGQAWERRIERLLLVLLLLISVVFLVGGWQFAQFGSTQLSEISGLPMMAIYIAWPIAGGSWILFLIEQVYDHFDLPKEN